MPVLASLYRGRRWKLSKGWELGLSYFLDSKHLTAWEHAVPLDVLLGWLSEWDISSTGSLCKQIYLMNSQHSELLPEVALEHPKGRI